MAGKSLILAALLLLAGCYKASVLECERLCGIGVKDYQDGKCTCNTLEDVCSKYKTEAK